MALDVTIRNTRKGGNDYPLGFVRWTEQRNFEAVLEMMSSGRLDVRSLITHRFPFDEAPSAYELLAAGTTPYLGIVLEYSRQETRPDPARTVALGEPAARAPAVGQPRVAFIGAGNYAGRVLIPIFSRSKARLTGIASSGGVTAAHFGRKFGFARATTDADALLAADDVDVVVITTRHDSHARFVISALEAGKDVFVEKPLGITADEIERIAAAWSASGPVGHRRHVMVGFNRRFAPQVVRMKTLLAGVREPKSFIVTVNAGAIPANHWTQDPGVGGGRIIGEGCHFVDLLRFLVGHPVEDARVEALGRRANTIRDDKVAITLSFADGSWGTIHYVANGHKAFPKERVEVFCAGRILQLDNFRRLRGWGWRGFNAMTLWRQDKGQVACVDAFIEAVREGGATPIPFEELLEVARVTIALGEAARA